MKSGKNRTPLCYDIFLSPIGRLFLIFAWKRLTGVSFCKPPDIPLRKGAATKRFLLELDSYFKGENCRFTQEIVMLSGTDFERQVWLALAGIPFGETRTYKWVAEKVGNPGAVRAVGRALSKNPVPIIIPCHRVIESDGSLGGYSSGAHRKRRLLELEYYAKMNVNTKGTNKQRGTGTT